jgi:hypothetical protein
MPPHVDEGERHQCDETRQHEQQARDQTAPRTLQQPAHVGRELLCFGSRQQHAIVERVQETGFTDPALLVDEDAVHDRDLAGRATERQQADAHPGARGFGEGGRGDAQAPRRIARRRAARDFETGMSPRRRGRLRRLRRNAPRDARAYANAFRQFHSVAARS